MSAQVITMADFAASKAQAAQYVRRPVSVTVDWSEAGCWEKGQVVPFAEFEKQAAQAALAHAGAGYLKTSVTVKFDDATTFDLRLDLAASDALCIADHCLSQLRYAETEEGRQRIAEYPDSLRPGVEYTLSFIRGIDFGINEEELIDLREQAEIAEDAALLRKEQEARATAAAEKKAKQEARAAEAARLAAGAPEYAHLVPLGEKDRGGVAAAKNVRRDLKQAFPGVKFSVKSSYTTINVNWQDGPTRSQVEAVIDKYQQGTFDGMTDCYEYHTTPFNELYGAVQYTFASRDHSEELCAAATRLIEQQSGETVTGDNNQRIWNEWASTLVWREAGRITLVDGVWHHDGAPIAWEDEQQSAELVATEEAAAEAVPVVEEQAAPVVEVAKVQKPKFAARKVGDLWSVTIEHAGECHPFEGITAASMADACRIAWAMLTQPTPPDDDPSGEPLPVEQAAEQGEAVDQGAAAPTLTRAQLLGDYRGRVEGKRERLEERAGIARAAGSARHGQVRSIMRWIEPGQPILVGHHSERRHRRAIARADQHMAKAVEFAKKAERLDQRAEAVGHGGIASDDPAALQQLRAKLAERQTRQEKMKAANKAKRGTYQPYQLSNNNAEIRRLIERIKQVEELHQAAPIEKEGNGWSMSEDDGRILVQFDQRQPDEVIEPVRSAGFVFARSRRAWVRKVTANAVTAAERLADKLAKLLPEVEIDHIHDLLETGRKGEPGEVFQLCLRHDKAPANKIPAIGLASVKIDGMFVAALHCKGRPWFFARSGQLMTNTDLLNIPAAVLAALQANQNLIHQFEFKADSLRQSVFNGAVSPARVNPVDPDVVGSLPQFTPWLINVIPVADFIGTGSGQPLAERKEQAKAIAARHGLQMPEHRLISWAAAMAWFAELVDKKEEGIVYDNPEAAYVTGARRADLSIKRARELRLDLRCVGVAEGKGKHAGVVGKLLFEYENGQIPADLGEGWGYDDRVRLMANPAEVVGQLFEVYAFDVSELGKLRQAKVGQPRPDKLIAD